MGHHGGHGGGHFDGHGGGHGGGHHGGGHFRGHGCMVAVIIGIVALLGIAFVVFQSR